MRNLRKKNYPDESKYNFKIFKKKGKLDITLHSDPIEKNQIINKIDIITYWLSVSCHEG